jgi:hypothetical protein
MAGHSIPPGSPHRTKKGSNTKGTTAQRIGRAHAIRGFAAGWPLMRRAIAGAPLAVKEDQRDHVPQDYGGHDPATGMGTLWTCCLHKRRPKGTSRHKDDVGDVSAADTGHHFWIRSTGCYLAVISLLSGTTVIGSCSNRPERRYQIMELA